MLRDPPTLTTPKEERRQLARQALQQLLALMELNMEYESDFLDMKGVHGSIMVTPVSANDGINNDLDKLGQLRAERRRGNRDNAPRSLRYSNYGMAQRFRLQFNIAYTFCHEIAHAVGFAVDEENLDPLLKERASKNTDPISFQRRFGTNKPYLARDRIAELEYAWETQVFRRNRADKSHTRLSHLV